MKRSALAHTKLRRLVRALGVPTYAAVGILEMLWHLTAREAPQGNIGKLEDADIADAVGWLDCPDRLISSLIEAGWLDESREHRLLVHDWHEHADDAVKKNLNRQRLPFLSRNVATNPDISGTQLEKNRLPEPEPEPEPSRAEPGPRLSPLGVDGPSPELDRSVFSRVLCERVGIFDMRQQADVHKMFDSYMRHHTSTMGDAVEHIASRWEQYQRAGPDLEWTYGSAHKFFMSGQWDKPETWRRKDGNSGSRYDEAEREARKLLGI